MKTVIVSKEIFFFITQKEAYFGCTAVPDDSFVALALAGQPSFFLLASLVQPRLHEQAGDVVMHKNSAGSRLRMIVRRQSHSPSGVVGEYRRRSLYRR
jgi:hypothetical protein